MKGSLNGFFDDQMSIARYIIAFWIKSTFLMALRTSIGYALHFYMAFMAILGRLAMIRFSM